MCRWACGAHLEFNGCGVDREGVYIMIYWAQFSYPGFLSDSRCHHLAEIHRGGAVVTDKIAAANIVQ